MRPLLNSSRIKYALILVVLFLVVTAVALGGFWLRTGNMARDTYESTYSYDLYIDTNSTLHDVTLYVPIPTEDSESEAGRRIVANSSGVYRPSYSGWNYSLADTPHGRMLSIRADEIRPRYIGPRTPLNETDGIDTNASNSSNESHNSNISIGYDVKVYFNVSSEIDTRNASVNEPVLAPKYNFTRVDCYPPGTNGGVYDPRRCYRYDGRLYASYNTSANTRVSISVSAAGDNTWWVLGWSGNSYSDSSFVTLRGSQKGWLSTQGSMDENSGDYLE